MSDTVLKNKMISDYKHLHKIPETGFDLKKTADYVKQRLSQMNIKFSDCGKCGIVALIGNEKAENCILLRADMDALPIREESGLAFSSLNGNMHACGHDMHTSILLGAAMILKKKEEKLKNRFKLLFQPAEETLEGAADVIQAGVLENPKVNYAVMLHTLVGTEFESGSLIISDGGVSAPGADYFRVKLSGMGCHGSMPEKGKDPLAVACRIITALDEIKSKELAISDKAVISVGMLNAGQAGNVIPDTAEFSGTLRAYSEKTRALLKKRVKEISSLTAKMFGVKAETVFENSCPSLLNNEKLSEKIFEIAKNNISDKTIVTSGQLIRLSEKNDRPSAAAGSEDFAYISRKVPSVMVAICAGKSSDGYVYPLHHPKVKFDTDALAPGAEFFALLDLL